MTRAEGLFGAEKGHGSFVKAVCTRMRRRESGPPTKPEERNVLRAFQKNQGAGAPRSSAVDDSRKHRTGDQAAARGPMLKQILGVGGWTLVSRVTGLIRDIVIAAVLGSGVMYEAFAYAFRLPNHFRAIFGEGAFNAAYVPSYAKAEAEGGCRRDTAAFGQRVHAAPWRTSDHPRAGLDLHADARPPHRARPLRAPRRVRPRGDAHAHHLPLSSPHHARDPAHGDAQRLAPLRRRGCGADPPQPLARALRQPLLPVSERRACGRLRRHLVGGACSSSP